MEINNFSEKEEFLVWMNRNSSYIFSEMKKDRKSYFKSYTDKNFNFEELLNLVIENFYNSFKSKKKDIDYFFMYYCFQSFMYSDPDNYFLYDEDVIQELLSKTYFSFIRFSKKYYNKSNLKNLSYTVSFETFILRNFSKVMSMEFRNIKRIAVAEEKRACSFLTDNSESYDDFLKSLCGSYELNDDLLFLTDEEVLEAYG